MHDIFTFLKKASKDIFLLQYKRHVFISNFIYCMIITTNEQFLNIPNSILQVESQENKI